MTQKQALEYALEEYVKMYEFICQHREKKINVNIVKKYLMRVNMCYGICYFLECNKDFAIVNIRSWSVSYADGKASEYGSYISKLPVYCKTIEELKTSFETRIAALRKRLKIK